MFAFVQYTVIWVAVFALAGLRFAGRLLAAVSFGGFIGTLAFAWVVAPANKRRAIEIIIARAFGVQPEPTQKRQTQESKKVRAEKRQQEAQLEAERNRIAHDSKRIQHYDYAVRYADFLTWTQEQRDAAVNSRRS